MVRNRPSAAFGHGLHSSASLEKYLSEHSLHMYPSYPRAQAPAPLQASRRMQDEKLAFPVSKNPLAAYGRVVDPPRHTPPSGQGKHASSKTPSGFQNPGVHTQGGFLTSSTDANRWVPSGQSGRGAHGSNPPGSPPTVPDWQGRHTMVPVSVAKTPAPSTHPVTGTVLSTRSCVPGTLTARVTADVPGSKTPVDCARTWMVPKLIGSGEEVSAVGGVANVTKTTVAPPASSTDPTKLTRGYTTGEPRPSSPSTPIMGVAPGDTPSTRGDSHWRATGGP